MSTRFRLVTVFAAAFALLAAPALALKNPAAVYCGGLGYKYQVERTASGEAGMCVLPDGRKVDAWQFLQGKVAQDRSYCASKGYRSKIVKDAELCLEFMTDSCLVCVLPDGREVEVVELMGVSLEETTCGDGTCGIPESYKSCPVDCQSGSADAYCDGVKDGRCDPDCGVKRDPDCPSSSPGGNHSGLKGQ